MYSTVNVCSVYIQLIIQLYVEVLTIYLYWAEQCCSHNYLQTIRREENDVTEDSQNKIQGHWRQHWPPGVDTEVPVEVNQWSCLVKVTISLRPFAVLRPVKVLCHREPLTKRCHTNGILVDDEVTCYWLLVGTQVHRYIEREGERKWGGKEEWNL